MNMSVGFWQIVVIALLGILLFGRGRISDLMGDVAKGIKSFKKGLSDVEDDRESHTEYQKIPEKPQILNHTPTSEEVTEITQKSQAIYNKQD
jgi:sec-independent protein translocase protein TatA